MMSDMVGIILEARAKGRVSRTRQQGAVQCSLRIFTGIAILAALRAAARRLVGVGRCVRNTTLPCGVILVPPPDWRRNYRIGSCSNVLVAWCW
jgi:hypothetical protein